MSRLPRRKKGSRVRAIYKSVAIQAAMAALQQSLAAVGDPTLMIAGSAMTVVNAALAAHMASQVEANRQDLSDRFEERIRKLEAKAELDEPEVMRVEFHALVFQAAVASAQESDTSKIDWYAAILAGAASTHRPLELNVRALLSNVTFLTADELRLARKFYEDFNQSPFAIVDGAPTPTWGPDTGLYLRRLETADLIVPRVVAGLPGGFQGPAGNYFVTSTFHRLMALVRETD